MTIRIEPLLEVKLPLSAVKLLRQHVFQLREQVVNQLETDTKMAQLFEQEHKRTPNKIMRRIEVKAGLMSLYNLTHQHLQEAMTYESTEQTSD